MRAVLVNAAGESPILGDLPAPVPDPGWVLIEVRAAGLNPVDNAVASGMFPGLIPEAWPVVMGRDAAGVVLAVGEGVTDLQVGDEVLGHVLVAPPLQAGTLAEQATLPASAVVRKPAGLDFVTAAAIPLAGAAAIRAVDGIAPQPGDVVLVNGASGGVGAWAVQLLARAGATVIATGSPSDVERLQGYGAASVVDFTDGSVVAQVLEQHVGGVDALVNLAGFTTDAVPLSAVKAGGRVSTTTGAPDPETAASAGLAWSMVIAVATSDVLARLVDLVVAGEVVVPIDAVLTLEQATSGYATLATGQAHGKLVVSLGQG